MTSNRAELIPFYRDILGLDLLNEDPFGAAFALGGGGQLRLSDLADHVPSPHPALGWEVDDIAATAAGLASKGVVFEIYPGFDQGEYGIWTAPDRATKINWFKDSEGNLLSLTQTG